MRLQYTSWLAPTPQLSALIRERERRFADECEHDFGLLPLADVVVVHAAVSDFGGREGVHAISQVGDCGLAFLLLMRDGDDGELARCLL